ncbi:NAD(P)-binding domain-containing protein [Desulfitispora alkaliphila]|uniref:NAD(P)-binding domain-containing protein n=1 Tax=Desulfitispora alkaliphila TaxID=622674 RepID=UPI003D2284B5
MDKFAFIIHPLDTSDIYRKFSFAKKLPEKMVERAMRFLPPVKASYITNIKSKHNTTEGWFVACPLSAKQMVDLPTDFVIKRIIQTGKLAEKLGAKVVGLGAMTSVVGDAGITVAKNLNIPVTTGNSYTVATAIEGTKRAAKLMGKDLKEVKVAIIGATGSIGNVCAHLMARETKDMVIVARDQQRLDKLANKLLYEYGLAINTTVNVKKAVSQADVIISVTGSAESVIEPGDIKPGAVICDVARPRDVSKKVAEERDDVLIIEGGVVEVPGDVEFNFDFGFPKKTSYACMAETMILTLEKRFENYTLGRELSLKQVEDIQKMADKHGFKLAGFRSFERAVSSDHIRQIQARAIERLKKLTAASTL